MSISTIKMGLKHLREGPLPIYQTSGSAGADLSAAIDDVMLLAPHRRALIPTGVAIALPLGYEAQIRSRSGLALHHGVTVFNAPGTIDADYQGELKVLLFNQGEVAFEIQPGMRIAQLVIAPVVHAEWQIEDVFSEATGRGEQGFGSTGLL